MSGRAATQTPNRRSARVAKFFVALGLFVAATLLGLTARAQAPKDDKGDGLDNQPALPAHEPKKVELAEKFRIDKDRAIFKGRLDKHGNRIPQTGIEDFEPVASEKANSDEYQAWTFVVQFAKQDKFTVAELEQNASRELTRDDLINLTRYTFRLDLVRLDGKLTKVRRVAASKALLDGGTAELYEGLLVPLDEPPGAVVSFVFTSLPAELDAVKQKPVNEWVDADSWASAAGWFFKVAQDAPGANPIPVLIGRGVTLHKAVPLPPGATPENPAKLDRNLRVFTRIKDNAYIAKAEDNWEEVSAWNRVLLHARRFTPDDLERWATDVKFADLFTDGRRDFRLDLVRVEGRLIKLDKMKPGAVLTAAGVETAYEGWLVPKDEPRGNPVCVVFTDPPEGVEPTGRVNKWVSFAGYSFKLLWYKSGERDKDDPNKNVTKKAPLILGRAVINRPDPDAASPVSWGAFANAATVAFVLLAGTAGGLTWWFRRGDRQAKQEMDAHRARNPFGATDV